MYAGIDGQHARAGGAAEGRVAAGEKCRGRGRGQGGRWEIDIALNLAVGLQRAGAKVGLMDGDIYGPSMPTMLGIKGQTPRLRVEDHSAFRAWDSCGHDGFARGAGQAADLCAVRWRTGRFKQLLMDNTEWPELDYLIVDLPPGTGDVPLTLCQLLPLTRRGDRGDAAAGGAGRCDPGGADVPAVEDADAGDGGEHELFRRARRHGA